MEKAIKEAFEKTNAALDKLNTQASYLLESTKKTVQAWEDISELVKRRMRI